MTSPFLLPIPPKLARDPELGPYFEHIHKTLHDLTTKQVDEPTTLEEVVAALQTHGLTK